MKEAIAIVKKYRDGMLGMSMCEQIQRAVLNSIIEDLESAQQSVQSDGVCTCANVDDDHRGTWLVCGVCLKPRRR